MMRFLILTFGPFAIIGIAYWATAPESSAATISAAPAPDPAPRPVFNRQQGTTPNLTARCQAAAQRLQRALPAQFQIVIRPPFIIAGDLTLDEVENVHSEVIGPVARALRATYFQNTPRAPITIVICSTEKLFRKLAADWDGHLEAGYHGYYQRDKRRILLDLEAGNGSLAHELTHALSHADCENLPEWFDEGLGALHEEATYAQSGQRLIGLPNWRCQLTKQAAQSGRLPALSSLTAPTNFRTGDVGLNYAAARSICLFLQDRQALQQYYRALRTRPAADPNGLTTLCQVLDARDVAQIDRQFASWVKRRTTR